MEFFFVCFFFFFTPEAVTEWFGEGHFQKKRQSYISYSSQLLVAKNRPHLKLPTKKTCLFSIAYRNNRLLSEIDIEASSTSIDGFSWQFLGCMATQ